MCSRELLKQQEKPRVTQQLFPFRCENIVREMLDRHKTGRSTVETVGESAFVCTNGSVHMNESTSRNMVIFDYRMANDIITGLKDYVVLIILRIKRIK